MTVELTECNAGVYKSKKETLKEKFEILNISFDSHNLNLPGYGAKQKFHLAICSDVFENLLDPVQALKTIKKFKTLRIFIRT